MGAITTVNLFNNEVDLLLGIRKRFIDQRFPRADISIGEYLRNKLVCQIFITCLFTFFIKYRVHHGLVRTDKSGIIIIRMEGGPEYIACNLRLVLDGIDVCDLYTSFIEVYGFLSFMTFSQSFDFI